MIRYEKGKMTEAEKLLVAFILSNEAYDVNPDMLDEIICVQEITLFEKRFDSLKAAKLPRVLKQNHPLR